MFVTQAFLNLFPHHLLSMVELRCHAFHKECIILWHKQTHNNKTKTCPMCRQETGYIDVGFWIDDRDNKLVRQSKRDTFEFTPIYIKIDRCPKCYGSYGLNGDCDECNKIMVGDYSHWF